MFKKLKEKITTLSLASLIFFAVLCGFSILIGIVGVLYEVIILGIYLGNGVLMEDIAYGFLSIALPAYLLIFLIKLISAKKKGNKEFS